MSKLINKKTKILALAVALVLVIGVAVGGTLAWLIDETDDVVNTFTFGDINITLTETKFDIDDGDGNAKTNTYKMVPGTIIEKDPTITVLANSEDCWLFVKIEESTNFDDFMTYAIADGWTALDGNDGVYYREVTSTDSDQKYSVLEGNTVSVKTTVTKNDFANLDIDNNGTVDNNELPTLTFTAYAVQSDGVADAATAWSYANPTP